MYAYYCKKDFSEFYIKHSSTKSSLEAWYSEVTQQNWGKPEDVVKFYSSAEVITGKRIVFNIKGNHYHLIADIEFKLKIIFIVWIGTYASYDKINVEEIRYENH